MVKIVYAGITALSCLAGPVMAADWPPLAPGNPAGVKKAQDADSMSALYIVAGGALIAGIVVLASDSNNIPAPSPTTTSTST